MISFREALETRILVCDGAMGTLLYQKGVYINTAFEHLCLTKPELVGEVHREYISAGADIIETNTFGANRYRLAKFGLEGLVKDINKAAAQMAVSEARGGTYVAGSVGPLGVQLAPLGRITPVEALAAFMEQIEPLIEGGVDLMIFETFTNLAELEIAVQVARELDGEIPIIAQMSFTEEAGNPQSDPEELAVSAENATRFLDQLPVDVIGVNCSLGPAPMLDAVSRMVGATKKPVSAMPNAGNPRIVEGRLLYMTTPEYLATYAKRFIRSGVKVIGGCCGTVPAHIRALRGVVKALSPSRISVERVQPKEEVEIEKIPTAEKTPISKKLAEGKFVTCVELLPPKGPNAEKTIKMAQKLKDAGIDAVNIPDGPRAMARMSPMSLAILFNREVGINPILHYTCRDRNILGMQSDLLGANAVGLKDILAVTGDPPKLGNYPDATAVYDVDAIGLVKIIDNLNRGLDVAGNPIGSPTAIHIGVGVNPVAINLDQEIERLRRKVENGAEYIFTQPVFDEDKFFDFLELTQDIKIPLFIGILPLASLRMAEFLHNEVPGMSVPERVRRELESAGDDAKKTGIAIAGKALKSIRDHVQGVYVMSPAGGVKSAIALLEEYL